MSSFSHSFEGALLVKRTREKRKERKGERCQSIYFEYFSTFKDVYPAYLPKGYEGSKHDSLIQEGLFFQSA